MRCVLCVVGMMVLAGCGAIQATTAIGEAQLALETAKQAKADRHAVFEFTSAEAYLDKAREDILSGEFPCRGRRAG